MSHEIENEKFVGTKLAWHRVGTVVDKAMTSREAIEIASLDTYNELQPMYVKNEDDLIEVPDKQAVVRLDDNKILGVVGNNYEIIQNRDCFQFMDNIIGEGRAVYETAGSLRGGTRLFLTIKLPEIVNIGPDQIDKYICLSTSHDGSLSLRVQWTPVRVVCANTLSVALRGYKTKSNGICIRHTPNYKSKVDEARRILNLTDEYYRYMEQEFNQMLETKMTKNQFNKFADELLPKPKEGKSKTKWQNQKDDLFIRFKNGAGHENIRGTRWAAFNAVTEYADHSKTTRVRKGRSKDDVKMENALWGTGAAMKQKAYNLLTIN